MKKVLAYFVVAVMLLTMLLACGVSNALASSDPIVIKLGHAQPETTPRHLSLVEFAKMVEEKSNGGMKIEIYANGQLGTEKEMLEAVKMGMLDAMEGGQCDFVPELLALTLPFIVENMDQVTALCESDLVKELAAGAEEQDMKILVVNDSGGLRNFSNNKHPIKKPEDLKGLKMRSNGMRTIDATLSAMGANIVSVPYADLYMALKTGVADGQENPYINVEAMKFYEVQKYFTDISYQFHPSPVYINLDLYNSLSPEYQQILLECAEEKGRINNQMTADTLDQAKAVVAQYAEIYEPTAEERQMFIDAATGVYEQFVGDEEGKLITEEQFEEMKAIIAGA